MCGILGYVGDRGAVPVLLQCLRNIAYRGYDSCGITLMDSARRRLHTVKTVGSPTILAEMVDLEGGHSIGIAHTRWATHGEPSKANAHPHHDCVGGLAIAHNGIIENFVELRRELEEEGHTFKSETDTEVIVHLIESEVQKGLALDEAVRRVTPRLEGAYAFVAMKEGELDQIVGVRQDCPLILGNGLHGEKFFTSDIGAIVDYCDNVMILEDGHMATISKGSIVVTDMTGREVDWVAVKIDWSREQAQRDGYPHFMLKEIHEQPAVVRDLLRERLTNSGETFLPELDRIVPDQVDQVVLMACGTASYACAFGKVLVEELTGLPVLAEVGSEFRYRRHFLNPRSLFVAISQSGETADTIAALRAAKEAGAPVLGLVNVMGTTIARESHEVMYTRGGPEAAVPSTKVFLNQLVSVSLVALHLARRLGETANSLALGRQFAELPRLLEETLRVDDEIRDLARRYQDRQDWFVIGRGLDEALAREAALKLKEVAYIHAESLAAGELKHGPIALVEESMPVLALVTQPQVQSKMANNVQEVAARGGAIIVFSTLRDKAIEAAAREVVFLPTISPFIDPILLTVPIQLLSYHCGVLRDANVDYPRNLAKSVTVE